MARIVELGVRAAARTGDDKVTVVLTCRMRVRDDAGAALDDVAEVIAPDDLAGLGVDLAQIVVVAADEQVETSAVAHQGRRARPARARPVHRRVVGEPARGPAAADSRLPDHVEVRRRGADAVEAPRLGAEEGGELDAVAVGVHGDRRRAVAQQGGRVDGDRAGAAACAWAQNEQQGCHHDEDEDGEGGGAAAPDQAPPRRRPPPPGGVARRGLRARGARRVSHRRAAPPAPAAAAS